MTKSMPDRIPIDIEGYRRTTRQGPCFICEIVAGNPDYRHHIVYEDDTAIAFLNKYPPLYGYILVAPRVHKEQVTRDFSLDEYLRLQQVVWRVGEAICEVVPTERLYVLSLGSRDGNRHVHWHLAPLPPGVAFEDQQLAALEADVLDLTDAELEELAGRLRAVLS